MDSTLNSVTTDPGTGGGRRLRAAWMTLRGLADWLFWFPAGMLIGAALVYELHTSALQALLLSDYAERLTFQLAEGPSTQVAYPADGPFDEQRGYSRLPDFQKRLDEEGFHVVEQARVSPDLSDLIHMGISPPYREKATAGLRIRARDGSILHGKRRSDRVFHSFDEVPPLLAQALLYIENREVLNPSDARSNPAVEWDRFAKASLLFVGDKLGLGLPIEGGSTLATQLEKFRHSPHGRTDSGLDKLRQMAAASLKAYRYGPLTWQARHEIVVDYLNTMPLAAAPGYGELYGLGDGLYAWFGLRLSDVRRALDLPDSDPRKAVAFKHALALIAAVRAPSFYLKQSREALIERVDAYTKLLSLQEIISPSFAAELLATRLDYLPRAPIAPPVSYVDRKAPNAIRNALLRDLGVSDLYTLDRLDLTVDSSVDPVLQGKVADMLQKLSEPEFVDAHGLRQEHLLLNSDPSKVIYSLMLFERTEQGNLLRVQVDSLDSPFDINEGVKLELGSTAKMRTLAHYLEVVGMLYDEMSPLDPSELAARAKTAKDPITEWVATTLAADPKLDLNAVLEKSLDRKYSANPGEVFFTGGGRHTFGNFEKEDNYRILTVREALQRSVNLVFIRLMRDLVRYHRARLPYDSKAVLTDPSNPTRLQLLQEIADGESRHALIRAYRRFHDLDSDQIVAKLLGSKRHSTRHLAILFYAWKIGQTREEMTAWLKHFVGDVEPAEVTRLMKAYSNPRLNLSDYAYLLSRDPLYVWCAEQMRRNKDAAFDDLYERSAEARKLASSWLFRGRNRRAQDLRLRIKIEADAFARMTPYWQRLAFPFEHLSPTYATAIGSSSDRPAALAELMGIILNDGVRRRPVRMMRLHFAARTPYEMVMEPTDSGERVMRPEIARLMRDVLAGVVEQGTARRLAGSFHDADGRVVRAGGKTGSGDNRFKTFNRGGGLTSSRAVNRTATFVFYIGDRYFGVITAYVDGPQAAQYQFTSSLPVSILRMLAPVINEHLAKPLPDRQQAKL
jgi:membrane peptidoglycan carboxypeptidase